MTGHEDPAKPETQKMFADMGFVTMMLPPEDSQALIATEIKRWAKVVKDANLKAE